MSNKKFGKYISMLTKYTHSYFDRELKNIDLGRGGFSHLMRLYEKDCVSQDYLSKEIHVDKGSTAKAIKNLLDGGYVTRETIPEDKRAYSIKLTDKAWELKKQMTTISNQWNEIVKVDVSDAEFNIFIKVAVQMSNNAKAYHDATDKGENNE